MENKEYQKPALLRFKWTVSKGRNTYGYNICSLIVDGSKVASCNGGGYDMKGTVLADYIEQNFQDRLLAIKEQAARIGRLSRPGGKGKHEYDYTNNESGLYGMLTVIDEAGAQAHVSIDGACGLSSVEKIAKAAGITLTSAKVDKDEYGYFLTV